ncbi:hypothetical protein CEP54_008201 [Fusarium duplospermum]|uniref:Carboxypeptidase n=1 Tax=Fusarium duplospermum TaxID=1325734 RepID=A0A428PX81_9HYPO|nr:hypothetical protein CEP54_008201 [Fusarium duplospermum]
MLGLFTWGLVALASKAQAAVPLVASPTDVTHSNTPFSEHRGIEPFTLRLGYDTASVCNSSTPGTSGFITSKDSRGGKNSIFFWPFESKNDPKSDPVILWMTGSQGLHDASTTMDQFLRQFMIAFPDLADRDFIIAGESYGGSWVPALATTILQSQGDTSDDVKPVRVQGGDRGAASPSYDSHNRPHINLKGVMIGNCLIRRSVQNIGFFETVCAGPDNLFNTSQCLQWAPLAMWCEEHLVVCETDGMTSTTCKEAEEKCNAISRVVVEEMHRNPYDFRQECHDPEACYSEMKHINEYLNRTYVEQALGVLEDVPFVGISCDVLEQWEKVGDLWRSSDNHVNYLLKSNIRVLIYVGDKDLYCNSADASPR